MNNIVIGRITIITDYLGPFAQLAIARDPAEAINNSKTERESYQGVHFFFDITCVDARIPVVHETMRKKKPIKVNTREHVLRRYGFTRDAKAVHRNGVFNSTVQEAL